MYPKCRTHGDARLVQDSVSLIFSCDYLSLVLFHLQYKDFIEQFKFVCTLFNDCHESPINISQAGWRTEKLLQAIE